MIDVVKSTVCVEKYAMAPWSPNKAVGTDATYRNTQPEVSQQSMATRTVSHL